MERGAAGAVSGLASAFPERVVALVRDGAGDVGALRRELRPFPVPGGREVRPRPAGRARARGRSRTASAADRRRAARAGRVARIVVAGAGAIGASHRLPPRLAAARATSFWPTGTRRGRRDRQGDGRGPPAVLDRGRGAARAGEHPLLRGARPAALRAGRLPVPRHDRGGPRCAGRAARAAGGARRAGRAGRPVLRRGPAHRRRARRGRLLRGRHRPTRRRSRASSCAARRSSESRCARAADAADARRRRARDRLRPLVGRGRSRARGRAPGPAALPPAARRRPVPTCPRTCRWCSRPRPASISAGAGERLVLAMVDPEPRWGFDEVVDETLCRRPARAAPPPLPAGRRCTVAAPGPASTT